jgi:hypothetical protein
MRRWKHSAYAGNAASLVALQTRNQAAEPLLVFRSYNYQPFSTRVKFTNAFWKMSDFVPCRLPMRVFQRLFAGVAHRYT